MYLRTQKLRTTDRLGAVVDEKAGSLSAAGAWPEARSWRTHRGLRNDRFQRPARPVLQTKRSGSARDTVHNLGAGQEGSRWSLPEPVVRLQSKDSAVQRLPNFKAENEAILHFEDKLLDDLIENYTQALELQQVAETKGWEDLKERINYYLKEDSKSYNEYLLSKLDRSDLVNLRTFLEMLKRAQEHDWEDLEDSLLHIVRKLEDERDFGSREEVGSARSREQPGRLASMQGAKLDKPRSSDKAEASRLSPAQLKGLRIDQAFMKFIEAVGGKREAAAKSLEVVRGANTPHGDPGKFMASQHQYQNLLLGPLAVPKGAIMDFHQSAGYEFEFGGYGKGKELTEKAEDIFVSHVVLGESAPIGKIFGLPYKLETDAGNALEMVTPPYLLLFSKDSKPMIRGALTMLTEASEVLRDQAKGKQLTTIGAAIKSLGFGTSWTFTGDAEDLVVGKNLKSGGSVYGQVNVSMTLEELGELLSGRGEQGEVFKVISGVYKAVLGEKADNRTLNTASLMYARYVANLLAIPSIMERQAYKDPIQRPKSNKMTEVKEALSVWIKMNPHVLISQFLLEKGDLETRMAFIRSIEEKEAENLHSLNQVVETDTKLSQMNTVEIRRAVAKRYPALDLAAVKKQFGADQGGIVAHVNRHHADKKQYEQQLGEENRKLPERWQGFAATMKAEFLNMNKLLKKALSGENVPGISLTEGPKPEFLKEAFGKGLGVRKDTYVRALQGTDRTIVVVELRDTEKIIELTQDLTR